MILRKQSHNPDTDTGPACLFGIPIRLIVIVILVSVPFIAVALSITISRRNADKKLRTVSTHRVNEQPVTPRHQVDDKQPIPAPVYKENPLNGVQMPEDKYNARTKYSPLAIVVNNHTASRPQFGVNNADIVIEYLVEAGITRFLEIHWSQDSDDVGSVRSLRNYALEWTLGYDALLVHDGWAATDNAQTDARGNVYRYGAKDMGNFGSWRSNIGGRIAPHNEFVSPHKIWQRADELGWNNFDEHQYDKWAFKDDANPEDRGNVSPIRITFANTNALSYRVEWKYDKTDNRYYRFTNNIQDVDGVTGEPVKASTVIVQFANHAYSGDEKGRIIITTVGSGDAMIFHDGHRFPAKWYKANRNSRTYFKNKDGSEHKLTRGQIWIDVVSTSWSTVDYPK